MYRYVIHSENQSSVHISNQNALIHDVILVLGKKSQGSHKKWRPPDKIRKNDSYRFCKQCDVLSGYLLNTETDADGIKKIWNETLVN